MSRQRSERRGVFLEADPLPLLCGKLPLPLAPCGECGAVIDFGRTVRRFPRSRLLALLAREPWPCRKPGCTAEDQRGCWRPVVEADELALVWVGPRPHKTPESFMRTAVEEGALRKRIPYPVPSFVRPGATAFLLAHPNARMGPCPKCGVPPYVMEGAHRGQGCKTCSKTGELRGPGIFHVVFPRRIVVECSATTPPERFNVYKRAGLVPVLAGSDWRTPGPAPGGTT